MKRFRLLVVPGVTEADTLNWREHLLLISRSPLDRETMDYEEMDKAVRLLRALKAAEPQGVLELEDADHALLVEKLKKMRWTFADERVTELIHTVINATEDVLN